MLVVPIAHNIPSHGGLKVGRYHLSRICKGACGWQDRLIIGSRRTIRDMEWNRKDALRYALSKGVQISPDAFEILKSVPSAKLEDVIKGVVLLNRRERRSLITGDDLAEHLGLKDDVEVAADLRVLSDPTGHTTTGEGADGYGSLFVNRYEKLKGIMSARPDAKSLRTLAGVGGMVKEDGDDVSVAGLVDHKEVRPGRADLRLEDPTGMFTFPVFNQDLQKEVDLLMQDQFVMIKIGRGKKGIYVKDIIQPDTLTHTPHKSESEAYVALLSDLHVGSKYFMEEKFRQFITWLSAHDAVAARVRFVLLCGDVVDGVGIYKDQDKELLFDTVEEQLARLEELIDGIPKHIKVVIAPGNHDPGRRALPQPAIPEKYCPGLWNRDNVTMVGNPAMVSLNGVRVLMFHGQSIDDIVRVTPGVSYDEPAAVMKHLLRARHLSPIYGGRTPIAPESEDWMVISEVADIFHVGHVHRWAVDRYRGTLLVNSGAWQQQTPFQLSVGIVPDPGIVTLVNLKTWEVLHEDYNRD